MPRLLLWILVISTTSLLAGGCPNTDSLTPSTTDPNDPTTAGVTQGTQSFADQLAEEFPTCGEPDDVELLAQEVINLVNEQRAAAGLNRLSYSQTLTNQATQYACELIHYDFFAHENPYTDSDLASRAAEFEYDYVVIGENLAAGQTSPEQAMTDWMNSPGHRENILHPAFTEIGVGVRSGGRYGLYWVQEFGHPAE